MTATGTRIFGIADYAARVLAHVEEVDGCWRWNGYLSGVRGMGYRHPRGYGAIGHDLLVHRVVFEALNGPLMPGLVVDHECHNRDLSCEGGDTCPHRMCVNPDHLGLKEQWENTRASTVCPSTINVAKTHCPIGHPYDEVHTYFAPRSGWRQCRPCARANRLRRDAANPDRLRVRRERRAAGRAQREQATR